MPAVPLWFGNKEAWQDVQPDFMNDDWKDCVNAIRQTIEKLDKQHKIHYRFKYPLFVNMPLLCIYHSHLFDHHCSSLFIEEPESSTGFNIALRYMRFASAAYGAVYMRFLNIIKELPISSQVDMDVLAISQHTGVFKEDIFDVQLTGIKVACPSYFIAVDRAMKSVVVTIRGTANFADVITDLVCESVRFLGGHAHDGIKRGAERLFEETIKTVCSLLDRNPTYSLVITGHSLGAGTSILLTMLYLAFQNGDLDNLREILPSKIGNCILRKGVNIKCYAFAPPPVFSSPNLLDRYGLDSIHVYINHSDVVPRLSLATFNDMIYALQKIDMLKLDMKERLQAALSNPDHPTIVNLINMIKSVVHDYSSSHVRTPKDMHFIRLHIPGKIHLLHRKPNKDYHILRRESDFFKHMLFVKGFFADHLPDQYEDALKNVCQALQN